MIIGTVSLWLVGIPMAYYFGFILHEGAQGVRWGFTVGVALSMLLLAISWYQPFNNPHKLDHDNCLATEG
jgi:MATE family multidrug resistance protein